MLEDNVFRLIMFIGAVIVIGLCITLIMNNLDDITSLFDQFFSYRLQKY